MTAWVGVAAQAGPNDFFTEHAKDFGVTPRGPVLKHYFYFKNTSNQTVTLGTPRVSCGCVSASTTSASVKPGETAAVVAFMDTRRIPQANVTKTVTVYVPFLQPGFEEVQLRVTSVAREDLMMAPDTLAMGTVKRGSTAKASTKVTFLSDSSWKLLEAKSTGGFVKTEFQEVSRSGNQVTYEVSASLDPTCPAGNWHAEVWVKSSNPMVEKMRIPLTVNVESAIMSNPDHIQLTGLKVGEAVEHRVILTGTTPFKVTGVKGVDAEVVVDPNNKDAKPVQVLKVMVTPGKTGEINRTLEIATDHPDQKTLTIPLKAAVGK
jgi:hypothetical protein